MSIDFDTLKGKTFKRVEVTDDEIKFLHDGDGNSYILFHSQDCCESVYLESVDGDIANLLPDQPILEAYGSFSDEDDDIPSPDDSEYVYEDSYTWSFYVIRTMLDTFTIRFFGTSNGCYSETADLYKLNVESGQPEWY